MSLDKKDKHFLAATFCGLILIRLALLGINEGEYTDGILQITQFKTANDIYPPFYSLLCYVFGGFGAWLEWGGKMISALSGAALIFPLYFLSRAAVDQKTARWACVLYFISPIPLRWSIRVMSDSLFSLLFLLSVFFYFIYYSSCFAQTSHGEKDEDMTCNISRQSPEQNLILAIFLSVLTTLTHYRGIILLPLSLLPILSTLRIQRRFAWRVAAANLLWGFIPVWIFLRGFRHFSQLEERMGMYALQTFLNYLNNFESFVLLFPYFLTYPIAFFVLYGFFCGRVFSGRRAIFSGMAIFLFAELLVMQSIFSSFQSRYFLPIIPLLLIIGAVGILSLREKAQDLRGLRILFRALIALMIIWGIGFSLLVCYLQRGAFGDIKKAGVFISGMKLPDDVKIYSNEFYKSDITGTKLAFWSGKRVELIGDINKLPANSMLVLHSGYGGMSAYIETLNYLLQAYEIKKIASFEASLVPLLPDIMEEPGTHQNPAAWVFRYIPQHFETSVFAVISKKENRMKTVW